MGHVAGGLISLVGQHHQRALSQSSTHLDLPYMAHGPKTPTTNPNHNVTIALSLLHPVPFTAPVHTDLFRSRVGIYFYFPGKPPHTHLTHQQTRSDMITKEGKKHSPTPC